MLKRKDGRWQEYITVCGKRKYFYGKTKKETLDLVLSYKEQNDQKSTKTFNYYALNWKEEHKKDIVPSTLHGYEPSIYRAIKQFGECKINTILPIQIEDFLKQLKKMEYSRKTVSTQLNVLNMIFDYAVRNNAIQFNPCASVHVPRGLTKSNRKNPAEQDIEAVNNSDWLLPFFLLYSGCRRGEALALTYGDIDRKNMLIHITKSIGYDRDIPFIKKPKTESGYRDIILLPKLEKRIPMGKKTELLFPNKNGRIMTSNQFIWAWDKWRKENNTTVSAHQLRHGYATLLYDAGIDEKGAQYLLGHATISMTKDIYTHIRQSKFESMREKLNKIV